MKIYVIIASRDYFRSMVGSGSISPDIGLLGDDMIIFLTSAIVDSSNDATCVKLISIYNVWSMTCEWIKLILSLNDKKNRTMT